MSRPAPALATFGTPPPRIHERTQIIEPVSGDQSGRHQFPQPLFDFRRQMTRHFYEIREETGTSFLQVPSNVLRDGAQGGVRI
jgi:hypothetical protein